MGTWGGWERGGADLVEDDRLVERDDLRDPMQLRRAVDGSEVVGLGDHRVGDRHEEDRAVEVEELAHHLGAGVADPAKANTKRLEQRWDGRSDLERRPTPI